mgnify:CR=1 FL=1
MYGHGSAEVMRPAHDGSIVVGTLPAGDDMESIPRVASSHGGRGARHASHRAAVRLEVGRGECSLADANESREVCDRRIGQVAQVMRGGVVALTGRQVGIE